MLGSEIMLDRLKRTSNWVLLLLAAAGLLLRLVAVDHGFPDVNEEATPVRQAWEMWDWERGGLDLNPRFFNYPALSFYINWIAQGTYRLATEPTGLRAWGPSEKLPLDLVLIGRILSILFAGIISVLTYRLGRRLMPAVWSAWAALLVFWMPTLFHYSLKSVVDLPLGVFSTLVLVALLERRLKTLSRTRHITIGVLVGLAASCKYTGAFLAIPYVLTHLSSHDWNLRSASRSLYPWYAGAASILVFLALNPYIILDSETFYWNYAFERHHMTVGHFGRKNSPISEYAWTVWLNLGPLFLISAAIGSAYSVQSRLRKVWIPLSGFAISYTAFLLTWSTSFGHYLLPVFPILALVAIQGIRICVLACRRRGFRHSGLILPLLAVVPLTLSSYAEYANYRQPAARTLAREWIEVNVPAGTLFASEPGGPNIRAPRYEVILPMHTTNPEQSSPAYNPKWYEPVDMILVVEGVESRYKSETERFPDQNHFYDQIDRTWNEIARFGKQGHGIRIYQNPDASHKEIVSYPDTLYARLGKMSRVLAGRFLDRLGTAYQDIDRLPFAGDVYNRLVTNLPDNQDYTLAYADVLLSLDRRDVAIRLLESRRSSGDDHLKASLHFLKAEYDSATASWGRFANLYPGNAKVRASLARIYLMMGKTADALLWYLETIKVGTDEIEPYLKACALLSNAGDLQQASDIARAGLKRWPANSQFRQYIQ
jgi:4-amino-4-deoxy-L-arabinose transferase-like glycosyltransferase